MSLPITVALSVVMMLLGIAIPAIMLVTAGASGSFLQWSCWFGGLLAVVFGGLLLQYHLHSLAPHYFHSGWEDWSAFAGVIIVALTIWSFLRTALNY